jgi:hypothetical protein
MKKTALILIALSIGLMASAQTTFESYMKRVPALPRDSCNISKIAAEDFVQQVSALYDEITNDIEERNRKSEEYAEKNSDVMKDNVVQQMQQQYGISDEDVSKMKDGKNMSAAEKQAMANKMMMQQTNISMDEAKNMSKMSDAGKKGWAEGYAAEAQANVQADPKKYAPKGSAGTLFTLTQEQQTLLNMITVGQQKIAGMYTAIENDPSGKTMLDNISKWEDKYLSMIGEVRVYEAHVMDSVAGLITNEEIKYCNKFTPKYRAVIRQDLANFKASLPDCRRLDEVSGDLMKLQTGVDAPPESAEITSLLALKAYVSHLRNAYKFKLHYPEDKY